MEDWVCQTCSKPVGRIEVVDVDTQKHYCGRACFDKRPRRRPLEHPIWLDTADADLIREAWTNNE